jgi:hypothetical protein
MSGIRASPTPTKVLSATVHESQPSLGHETSVHPTMGAGRLLLLLLLPCAKAELSEEKRKSRIGAVDLEWSIIAELLAWGLNNEGGIAETVRF